MNDTPPQQDLSALDASDGEKMELFRSMYVRPVRETPDIWTQYEVSEFSTTLSDRSE